MSDTARKCPFCAEEVQAAAKKCRHCHENISPGVCLKCGFENRLEARFCGKCGKPDLIHPGPELEKRKSPAPPPPQSQLLPKEPVIIGPKRRGYGWFIAFLLTGAATVALLRQDKEKTVPFDPDAYLKSQSSATQNPVPFDPVAYLKGGQSSATQNPGAVVPESELRKETSKPRGKPGMALIPAGEFIMGSPEGVGSSYEQPRHKVYLDAFYMDKTEVTFEQYDKYAGAAGKSRPSDLGWGRGSRPVINVSWHESWHDAAAYCKWAGKRLPTEAEWEKAARGGTDTKYSFGDDGNKLGDYAWYDENSGSKTQPVGQKKPNPYGLYDMHGNVWEWVVDWYGEDYYKSSPGSNPQGPASGTYRGLRGGSLDGNHDDLRSASRSRYDPVSTYYYIIGFRCVVSARD